MTGVQTCALPIFTPRTIQCFTNVLIAVDRPELLANPRYEPPVIDMDATREIRAVIDEAFGQMTMAEAGAALDANDVAWAAMGTLAELAASQMAENAGCFVTVEDGRGGSFRSPATPVRFPEGAPTVGRAAPRHGQHTREVLAAAGFDPDQILALVAQGAALDGPPA